MSNCAKAQIQHATVELNPKSVLKICAYTALNCTDLFFPDAEAARASAGKQLDYRSWEVGRLPLCYKLNISAVSTAERH